jgi:peptide/nickel transport system substrate-binding protein
MRVRVGERRRIVMAVACTLVAAGCGRGCGGRTAERTATHDTGAAVVHGGRLVVGIRDEPEVLTSLLLLTKSTRLVDNCIFSRFVTWDDSLRLVPDLITEIPTGANGGISPDNLTYTYRLRPGVRWHDGRALTAADVAFTYRVIMHPECGAETQQGFDIVERVETPDSLTVVFKLREPYAGFVADTFSDEDVLPRHLLESEMGAGFRNAAFHRAPIGSGPFRFQEWVPGSHVAVARNDDYYGGRPPLDALVFRIIPDANALALQLQAGSIDGIDGAEPAQRTLIESLPGTRLYRTASLSYEHIDFNCEHPVLADARVRRALAAATDRGAIATHVYEGLAQPARADVSPLMPWYDPAADTTNAYDAVRSRALLAAAGWNDTNGDGIRERDGKLLRLEISTTAGRTTRERVQAVLQQQWRDVGVDLQIRNYNPAVLFGSPEQEGRLRTGRFEIALFGWLQQPEPSGMMQVYGSQFIPPAGQNMARFRNRAADSLLALGAQQVALPLRAHLYRQVESILLREVPVVPLVWLVELDAMPARLRAFRPNPTSAGDTWNVHEWWLAADGAMPAQ